MKTQTQFFGFELKELMKLRKEAIDKVDMSTTSEAAPEEKPSTDATENVVEATANEATQEGTETTTASAAEEAGAEKAEKPSEPAAATVEASANEKADAEVAASAKGEVKTEAKTENKKESLDDRKKRIAAAREAEWMAKFEKAKPELIEALKAKFKWNDEKIELALNASRIIDKKRLERLRKISVLKEEKEGEQLPKFAKKIDEHVFLAEYLVLPGDQKPQNNKGRGGKFDKNSKGRGKFDKNGKGRGDNRNSGGGKPGQNRPGAQNKGAKPSAPKTA